MSRYVDYPAVGAPIGSCVILPGRQYPPDGPLLFFAAETAVSHGWNVRQVWWDAPSRGRIALAEEVTWVCGQLEAALEGDVGRVLVVAKSLGTLAAPLAAARGYDAAWLTPLLTEPALATVLLTYPVRQFVAIGASDPFLRRDVFEALPGERLLAQGDHLLRVPGDPFATMTNHEHFLRSFDAWLGASPEPPGRSA